MKFRNSLGMVALAFATVAGFVPVAALAAHNNGDIWSIGQSPECNFSYSNPAHSGQEVKFRVTLVDSYAADNEETAEPFVLWPNENYWGSSSNYQVLYGTIMDMVAAGTIDAGAASRMLSAVAPAPKIGVWFSGALHLADIDISSPESGYKFTYLDCSYTVQPGDYASPLFLANSAGTGAVSDGGLGGYYFENLAWDDTDTTSPWTLRTKDSGEYANFTFRVGDVVPGIADDRPNQDASLADAGIVIKTIDFTESNTGDESIWREVPQGRTINIDGAIEVPGGATSAMTLYVWIDPDDVGVVKLDPAQSGIETDGEGNQFLALTINRGELSGSFRVTGVSQDGVGGLGAGLARVYISSYKGFLLTSVGDQLDGTFLTAAIRCTEPKPPYISVKAASSASVSANYCDISAKTDYREAAATVTVTLSDAYSSAMTVRLTPALGAGAPNDVFYYIGLADADTVSPNAYIEWSEQQIATYDIPFAAGETYKVLNVYTLGADSSTASKGITFSAAPVEAEAQAFFNGTPTTDTMYIRAIAPTVQSPADGEEVFAGASVESGLAQTIEVTVADMYQMLNGAYTVSYWDRNAGELATDTVTAENGVIRLSATYYAAGPNTSKFRLKNAAGQESDYSTFIVNVSEPKKVDLVTVDGVFTNTLTCAESNSEKREFNVTLSEPYNRDLYAFLKPLTEESASAVKTTATSIGTLIARGSTVSTVPMSMVFPDGTATTASGDGLTYRIELRTSNDVEADDNIVSEYTSGRAIIFVNNEAPSILGVSISGNDFTENKGTFPYSIPQTLTREFTVLVSDVDADLGDDFSVEWEIKAPNGSNNNSDPARKTTGDPEVNAYSYKFTQVGQYTIRVRVKDKDTDRFPTDRWFEMYVNVTQSPQLTVSKLPSTANFKESATSDAANCAIYVTLDPAPPVDVTVNLTVENRGTTGYLEFEDVSLSFLAGETRQLTYPIDMNGTSGNNGTAKKGFTVTAALTEESLEELAAREVYYTTGGASTIVKIDNEAPVLSNFSTQPGYTNYVTIGESITLSAEISDVLRDAERGFTATWKAEGRTFTETVYPATEEDDTATTSYTFGFSSSGAKLVTLDVKDADGGSAPQQVFIFEVEAAKPLMLYATGPSVGQGSELSSTYRTALGIGSGRTDVDPDTAALAKISSWVSTYNCPKDASYATLRAIGYAVGDKNTLITPQGNSVGATADNCYTYNPDDNCDSFFYCWLQHPTGEGADSVLGKPAPAVSKTETTQTTIRLEDVEGESTTLPLTAVEAIFSREWIPSDNLGDINNDGIPDYFAISWRVASNYGSDGDSGDLFNYGASNTDEDMLPAASTPQSNIIPNIKAGWATDGGAFTARMELRGFGSGINFSSVTENHMRGVDLYRVTDLDLTDDEAAALKAASGIDFDLSTDDGKAEAKAWMFENGWTPENPTDPRKADTDGDGFTDGWEYYFWYNAKIMGAEGRRLNIDDPSGDFLVITGEEICEHFNPNVYLDKAKEQDFDADGLTDYEEFLAGTNPVDCDSDGDGLADGWEVMRGLNPLATDGSENPGQNPDGDYMAKFAGTALYTIYKYGNGYYAVMVEGSLLNSDIDEPKQIAVFKYGTDWVPATETVAGVDLGMDFDELSGGDEPAATVEASYVNLLYIHAQVKSLWGFDPRTGWYDGVGGSVDYTQGGSIVGQSGFLSSRWRINAVITSAANQAINTEPYTTRDEWLLMGYWQHVLGGLSGNTIAQKFANCTTAPLASFESKNYGDSEAEYAQTLHGADTNGDGIPDGWTLYTGRNPNATGPALTAQLAADDDTDGLTYGSEFASTDAMLAYSTVETIAGTHTASWINKFLPTDPDDNDTDGDGIYDAQEGAIWGGTMYAGRHSTPSPQTFSFIYNDSPVDTGMTLSFAGGGLNPCSVDTDMDGLPDGWEQQFAGLAFVAGGEYWYDGNDFEFPASVWRAHDMTGPSDIYSPMIIGGMDGTVDDAETDVDGDGLLAWQEYMVQSMRQFRYDDSKTPLMTSRIGTALASEPILVFTNRIEVWEALDATAQENIMQAYAAQGRTVAETGSGELISSINEGEGEIYFEFIPYIFTRVNDMPLVPFNCMSDKAYLAALAEAGVPEDVMEEMDIDFRLLGYFARPKHYWDRAYIQNRTSGAYFNMEDADLTSVYSEGGFRYMSIPYVAARKKSFLGYLSSDPRRWDTDGDSMDDYWEMFHGLNPILGTAGLTVGKDIISSQFTTTGSGLNIQDNVWRSSGDGYDATMPLQPGEYNVIKYPWLAGIPDFDADGDGLRNELEAPLANLTPPQPYHTDPTPLWYTDSSKAGSFTTMYYQFDPVSNGADSFYPWSNTYQNEYGAHEGKASRFKYAFEENEGYDTDGDWVGDSAEMTPSLKGASDPLLANSPDRRQAIYFPGVNSAAVSYQLDRRTHYVGNYDFFRQFTVECWVKPDGDMFSDDPEEQVEQVIIERVSDYQMTTMTKPLTKTRANFRIGLTKDGHPYGMFDNSDAVDTGTGAMSAIVTSPNRIEPDVWSHIALTFDGSQLKLYVNAQSAAVGAATTLIPANGVVHILQQPDDQLAFPVSSFVANPSATVIGAQAESVEGLYTPEINPEVAWGDEPLKNFYKGYVDEVRIWDGARTSRQILDSYQVRFTESNVLENRSEVFTAWTNGATRVATAAMEALPAELVCHYTFQGLPGATEPDFVADTPGGFNKAVKANAVNVDGSDWDISVGWWSNLGLRSDVYRNTDLVPWIANTVAHLPYLDGSSADSQYWGENLAGWTLPEESGVTAYTFPNTGMPYRDYSYIYDRVHHWYRYRGAFGDEGTQVEQWNFEMRSRMLGTSDLIPLGGAYAKRCSDYWDGDGAMDPWQLTKADPDETDADTDGDGLPDWWETLYGLDPSGEGDWANEIEYTLPNNRGTVNLLAWQAYLRDLMYGYVDLSQWTEGGERDDLYVAEFDTSAIGETTAPDANKDGLPDWWQAIYSIQDSGALADPDHDGLSNRAEYLISEVFGFEMLNPTLPMTDGTTVDYFIKRGELYLGEMFADHDQIDDSWEDGWENEVTSRYVWDALEDYDSDGWSNWAEAIAGTNPKVATSINIDRDNVPEFPEPLVTVTINSAEVVPTNASYVVEAWSDLDLLNMPDAKWVVASGTEAEEAGDTVRNRSLYLGWNMAKTINFTLGPGAVAKGTVQVSFKDIHPVISKITTRYVDETVVSKSTSVYKSLGVMSSAWVPYIQDEPRIKEDGSLSDYGDLVITTAAGTVVSVGEVNYITGSATLELDRLESSFNGDASLFADWDESTESTSSETSTDGTVTKTVTVYGAVVHPATSYVKAEWYGRRVDDGRKGRYYLGRADTGNMREGYNTFIVYADENGDGTFTPGELYGFLPKVNVGFDGVKIEVELTRTSPLAFRANLADSTQVDRVAVFGNVGDVVDFSIDPYNQSAQYLDGTSKASLSAGSDNVEWVRVRVARWMANGSHLPKSQAAVVLDKQINIRNRPVITEADFVTDERGWDVDWIKANTFNQTLTNVTYRIFFGNESIPFSDVEMADVASYPIGFSRRFDLTANRVVPSGISPANDAGAIVYSSHPTFTWMMGDNNEYNSFMSFRISVADESGSTIWVSPMQFAPARTRDSAGRLVYKYEAPIYAGSIVTNASGVASVFSNYSNYTWKVSMYNSKFQSDLWSAAKNFLMSANANHENGYGGIKVNVKYRGPDQVVANAANLATAKGKIRVQAFATAGFGGIPTGEVVATGSDEQVVIAGLDDGTHYIRAYIDTNGNGVKDVWESWGAYCGIGSLAPSSVFQPIGVKVSGAPGAALPECTVWIEDTDVDGDWLPDAWEMENGTLATRGGASLDGDPELDDFVRVNPELEETVSNRLRSSSSVLSGMSLAAFSNPNVGALMLGVNPADYATAQLALQAALSAELVEDGVTVSGLKFDDEGNIVLTVEAETEPNTVQAASVVYGASAASTATVRYEVLWRESLTDGWTSVASGVVEVGGDAKTITVAKDEILVDGATPASGFFKVSLSK